jgi:uncharacterized protein
MKWLFVAVINLYRWLPDLINRQCLFKETCSSFVERVARESGFWPGVRTLRARVSQCRPGYLIYFDSEIKDWQVRFADGSVSNTSDLADFVLSPYREISLHTWTDSDVHSRESNVLTLVPEKSGD